MVVDLYKLKLNTFICSFALVLSACTSTGQLDPLSEQEQADKKQAIETVIEEWQESKPSIKRLVAMEGDLNTLIDELSVLSSISDQVDEPVTNKVETISPQNKGKDKVTEASSSVAMSNKNKVDEKPEPLATNVTNNQDKKANSKVEAKASNHLIDATVNMPNKSINIASFNEKAENNQFKEPEIKQIEKKNTHFSSAIHLATFTTLQQSKQAWLRLNGRFSHHFKGKKPMVNNLNKDGIKLYRLQVGPYSNVNAEQLCGRLNAQNQHCIVVENEGSYLSDT